MERGQGPGALSLAEEQREWTRGRIRRAAMKVLAERGLGATVDDIAAAAGVSARTVFRHYAGADQLVAAAIEEMIDELGRPVEGLPDPTVDPRGWVATLVLAAHTRNAGILGRVFWDIHNPAPDTSPIVLAALSNRRSLRAQWMTYIANGAWRAAGGTGPVPPALYESFSLLFSAFVTNALAVEFDHSPEQAAVLTTDVLMTLLESTVARQRPTVDW